MITTNIAAFRGCPREEVVESGNLTYGIRTYSFWPFDFNQGYFNQFEVLESQKWPLVDKTKSFYIKSALSFSDFQLLYGQKTVYSLQPLLFLEIIALNLRLCISFSVASYWECVLTNEFKINLKRCEIYLGLDWKLQFIYKNTQMLTNLVSNSDFKSDT